MSTRSSTGKTKLGVMSRRGFLKGAGVTAVGTALGESALEAFAQNDSSVSRPVLGPGSVKISLDINGQKKSLEVEPRTTLAQALRDDLADDRHEGTHLQGLEECGSEPPDILQTSKRQVARIAADLDGELVDGRWLFKEATVRAYAEARQGGQA